MSSKARGRSCHEQLHWHCKSTPPLHSEISVDYPVLLKHLLEMQWCKKQLCRRYLQSAQGFGNGYSYLCCQWDKASVSLYIPMCYSVICLFYPLPGTFWLVECFLCASQFKLSQLKGDELNLLSAALDTMKCRNAAVGTCCITGKELLHFWWTPMVPAWPGLVEGPSQRV